MFNSAATAAWRRPLLEVEKPEPPKNVALSINGSPKPLRHTDEGLKCDTAVAYDALVEVTIKPQADVLLVRDTSPSFKICDEALAIDTRKRDSIKLPIRHWMGKLEMVHGAIVHEWHLTERQFTRDGDWLQLREDVLDGLLNEDANHTLVRVTWNGHALLAEKGLEFFTKIHRGGRVPLCMIPTVRGSDTAIRRASRRFLGIRTESEFRTWTPPWFLRLTGLYRLACHFGLCERIKSGFSVDIVSLKPGPLVEKLSAPLS
jgi:hypothetical protein